MRRCKPTCTTTPASRAAEVTSITAGSAAQSIAQGAIEANQRLRDAGWPVRREAANAEQGVWGCTLVGACSQVCPKGVDPAHAINQNKANSALDYFGLGKLLAPSEGAK